jgi:S-DNA-T family DNA segregation ATPase FtsK/SpoIIIE
VLTRAGSTSIRVLMSTTGGESLPHECRATLTLDGCRVLLRAEAMTGTAAMDGVDLGWGEDVGRALAPLRDATPGGVSDLPSRVCLSELLTDDGHTSPDRLWAHAPEGLSAVIGASAAGPISVDLMTDGPHALIGGTTGAGKSELLQTWIASLAQSYGPELLTFVLVDYKGGAAFSACSQLPHTVGMLTDLDPAETRRALRSLQAEVRRRERMLAGLGCSDIDSFRSRGGTLPRLVLVIDEFRALAEEQPDSLKELVHLAAVGRSLGLHLILATQRPSGVITPEIRANVNLRIALRVRDRLDSEDIIGTAEAAHLPEGSPGRALMRTGGEPPTSFQTASVGGRTSSGRTLVVHTGLPGSGDMSRDDPGPTELETIVAGLDEAWARSGRPAPHPPWQPPLPAKVTEEQLPSVEPGAVAWGLVDLPDEQRWDTLSRRPEDGHLLVLGGPGTGRTTAACSLATRLAAGAPNGAWVHALASPGPLVDSFAQAPHVASVLDPGDPSATRRLLTRVRRETDERRDRLRRSGHATMEDWVRSGSTEAPAPPLLVLVIDSWSHIVDEHDALAHETAREVEALARDGTSVGVHLIVTGGRDLATSRLASIITGRLVLHLPERHDALAAGVRPDELVDRPIPGRGVLLPARTLAQVAPLPATDRRGPDPLAGEETWRVVELPRTVSMGELARPAGALQADRSQQHLVLGHSGEAGRPVSLRPDVDGTWCVVGPRRSGRTTALRVIADQLRAAGRPLVQVAHSGRAIPGGHPVHGPDDIEGLVAHIRRHDAPAVLVDDIDGLEDAPVHEAIRALVDHCARSGALLLAATTTDAATRVRGLAPLVCRSRTGLLLQPRKRTDGDPLGVRVSPSPRIPGRGFLVDHGEVTEVQVALPDEPVVGIA